MPSLWRRHGAPPPCRAEAMAADAIFVGRRRYAMTGWIAGAARPVREGVYARREPAGP